MQPRLHASLVPPVRRPRAADRRVAGPPRLYYNRQPGKVPECRQALEAPGVVAGCFAGRGSLCAPVVPPLERADAWAIDVVEGAFRLLPLAMRRDHEPRKVEV